MIRRIALVGIVVWGCATGFAHAGDWPQWMGPQRDGEWKETGVIKTIPKTGLKVKWRKPSAGGYSGPAVAGGRVYHTEYVRESGELVNSPGGRNELNGRERIVCYDATSGDLVWKHDYPCKYSLSYACGPRATPTVANGKVYALGAEGDLTCLDASTGKVVWHKSVRDEYKVPTPGWGFCGHPLVDGKKLICLVGGEGSVAVAFDKDSGKELWKAISAPEPGYCPPSIIEAGGVRQVLIWDPEKINSLDPDTGKVYWSVPLKPDYSMSIMAPRKSGDFLFASGIGNVGAAFKLETDKPGATLAWKGTPKNAVYCANSTPIIDNGTIYGVCCGQGQLRAVKLENGDRLWESFAPTTGERRAGHGTAFLVKHEDRFFIFSETGDLVLAKLTPEKYEELGRFHVLEPTGECFGRNVVWSHPAFAERSLFARNDKELVCVSLAAE